MRLIDADAIPEVSWDPLEERAFREIIDEQPTIEAEPVRRGKWLTEYGDHIRAGLRPMFICCSECGMVTTVKWNYCPICGARMEVQA